MQTSIQECRNESIIFSINLQHWFSVKCQGLWNFFCIEIEENIIFFWNHWDLATKSLLQMVTESSCLINTWHPSKEVTLS